MRKLRSAALAAMTSRSQPPSTRVASAVSPGLDRRSRGSRAAPGRGGAGRRWCAGCAHPQLAARQPVRRRRAPARRRRRRAPRAGRTASSPRSVARWSASSRAAASGTWWARQVPSTGSAVDLLRAGPALRGAQHDHRPARPVGGPVVPGGALDRGDLVEDRVQGRGEQLVHGRRVVARRRGTACSRTRSAARQFVVADPGQHGRVGDLVAVEVQDRQDRAVADRVEELVRVPRRRERARSRPRRRR